MPVPITPENHTAAGWSSSHLAAPTLCPLGGKGGAAEPRPAGPVAPRNRSTWSWLSGPRGREPSRRPPRAPSRRRRRSTIVRGGIEPAFGLGQLPLESRALGGGASTSAGAGRTGTEVTRRRTIDRSPGRRPCERCSMGPARVERAGRASRSIAAAARRRSARDDGTCTPVSSWSAPAGAAPSTGRCGLATSARSR